MAPLERVAPDFVPETVISSDEMDQELNQLIVAINELRALVGIDGAPTFDADNLSAAFVSALGATQFSAGDYILSAAGGKSGWLLCDGASYLQADYPALFAVVGTTYGSVDGTHFNVPDFRGRHPVGVGPAATLDVLGETEGQANAALRTPWHGHVHAHTHTVPNHAHGITNLVGGTGSAVTSGGDAGNTYATTANPVSTPHHHNVISAGTTDVDGGGVQTGGASTPNTDANTAAYLTVNVFIKV